MNLFKVYLMPFCLGLSFDPSYIFFLNFRTLLPLKGVGLLHEKHFQTCLLVVGPDVTLHQRETASLQSVSLSSVTPGSRKLIAIRVFLRCDHIMGATLQSPGQLCRPKRLMHSRNIDHLTTPAARESKETSARLRRLPNDNSPGVTAPRQSGR